MTDTLPEDPTAPARARHRIRLATRWTDIDLAMITVTGQLDASNTEDLLDYVLNKALLCRRMVLDLTGLDYFSCSAYHTVQTIESRCVLADVALEVRTGPVSGRVLRICRQAASPN